MQKNQQVKSVGRPPKSQYEKKVQVIYYIPSGNVEAFKSKVEPIKTRFSKPPKNII